MGLADRFKKDLEKTDIFKKKQTTKTAPDSKAEIIIIEEPEAVQEIQDLKQPVTNPISDRKKNKFEDLETEIICKIRKTPYWNEYSIQNQENMIGSYFDKKTKNIPFSPIDKKEFIQNILILSNNQ